MKHSANTLQPSSKCFHTSSQALLKLSGEKSLICFCFCFGKFFVTPPRVGRTLFPQKHKQKILLFNGHVSLTVSSQQTIRFFLNIWSTLDWSAFATSVKYQIRGHAFLDACRVGKSCHVYRKIHINIYSSHRDRAHNIINRQETTELKPKTII